MIINTIIEIYNVENINVYHNFLKLKINMTIMIFYSKVGKQFDL